LKRAIWLMDGTGTGHYYLAMNSLNSARTRCGAELVGVRQRDFREPKPPEKECRRCTDGTGG
jgi:hypothetical protein